MNHVFVFNLLMQFKIRCTSILSFNTLLDKFRREVLPRKVIFSITIVYYEERILLRTNPSEQIKKLLWRTNRDCAHRHSLHQFFFLSNWIIESEKKTHLSLNSKRIHLSYTPFNLEFVNRANLVKFPDVRQIGQGVTEF